jgi:hypothetical protein
MSAMPCSCQLTLNFWLARNSAEPATASVNSPLPAFEIYRDFLNSVEWTVSHPSYR